MPSPTTPQDTERAIALNLQLYNDPEYQALLEKTKAWRQGGNTSVISRPQDQQANLSRQMSPEQQREYGQTRDRILAKYRYSQKNLPEGFTIGPLGELTPNKTWWETWRGPIITSAAFVGGALIAPYISPGWASGTPSGAAPVPPLMPAATGLPTALVPTAATTAAANLGAFAPAAAAGTLAAVAPAAAAIPPAVPPPTTPPPSTPPPSTLPQSLGDKMLDWLKTKGILSGIGLLGNYITGKIAEGGQDAAYQAQLAANDKTAAAQAAIYQQSRADLAPYREIGGNAMSTLGSLMGLGGGSGGGTVAPNAPLTIPAPGEPTDPNASNPESGVRENPDGTTTRVRPPGAPVIGHAVARGTAAGTPITSSLAPTAADLGRGPAMERQRVTLSSVAPPPQPSGETVVIQSPSGTRRAVPIEQRDYYVSRGGQVVA